MFQFIESFLIWAIPTALLMDTVGNREDYFCLDGEESHSNKS